MRDGTPSSTSRASLSNRIADVRSAEPGPGVGREDGLDDAGTAFFLRDSGIQFVDLSLNLSLARLVGMRFLEEAAPIDADDGGQGIARVIHRVRLEDDVIQHPADGRPVPWSQTYAISGEEAVACFAGAWLPLPLLRVIEADEHAPEVFDHGPTNWARVFMGVPGERDTIPLTLAIDTAVLSAFSGGRAVPELAPCIDDVEEGTRFRLARDADDVAGFASDEWVERWTRAQIDAAFRRAGFDAAEEAEARPGELWHIGAYLTLLEVLGQGLNLPDVRLVSRAVDPAPVPTDLTIDLGHSRTHAVLMRAGSAPAGSAQMLVERGGVRPQGPHSADASTASDGHINPAVWPVRLRNVVHPLRPRPAVFDSAVAFTKNDMGDSAASRMSGRAQAFDWPSLVALGPRAVALQLSSGPQSVRCGLSAPLRYLWDKSPVSADWQAGVDGGDPAAPRMRTVSGALMTLLTNSGELVGADADGAGTQAPAVRPRFSRCSITTLVLAEIILQAIAQLTPPGEATPLKEADRSRPPSEPARSPAGGQDGEIAAGMGLARRLDGTPAVPGLRSITVQVGADLLPDELSQLMARARDAVDLVWSALRWDAPDVAPFDKPAIHFGRSNADTGQDAYFAGLLDGRYGGMVPQFLQGRGRVRAESSFAPAVRLGVLHVGGGATQLRITTHWSNTGDELLSREDFSGGLRWGGDDIVERIARELMAPQVFDAGLSDEAARAVAEDPSEPAADGRDTAAPDLVHRTRLSWYLAVAALRWAAFSGTVSGPLTRTARMADLLDLLAGAPGDTSGGRAVLLPDAVPALAPLEDARIVLDRAAISAIVSASSRQTLRPVLNALYEFECDDIVMSGWISRLPELRAAVVASMGARADRVLELDDMAGRLFSSRFVSDGELADHAGLREAALAIAGHHTVQPLVPDDGAEEAIAAAPLSTGDKEAAARGGPERGLRGLWGRASSPAGARGPRTSDAEVASEVTVEIMSPRGTAPMAPNALTSSGGASGAFSSTPLPSSADGHGLFAIYPRRPIHRWVEPGSGGDAAARKRSGFFMRPPDALGGLSNTRRESLAFELGQGAATARATPVPPGANLSGDPGGDGGYQTWSFQCDLPAMLEFASVLSHEWPTSPAYLLQFRARSNLGAVRLPLTITIQTSHQAGSDVQYRVTEARDANDVAIPPETLELRLQTLTDRRGFWLDTGVWPPGVHAASHAGSASAGPAAVAAATQLQPGAPLGSSPWFGNGGGGSGAPGSAQAWRSMGTDTRQHGDDATGPGTLTGFGGHSMGPAE